MGEGGEPVLGAGQVSPHGLDPGPPEGRHTVHVMCGRGSLRRRS